MVNTNGTGRKVITFGSDRAVMPHRAFIPENNQALYISTLPCA